MLQFLKRANELFTSYVVMEGDSMDAILQKKIWWLLNLFSIPILLLAVVVMGDTFGPGVYISNLLFLLSLTIPLLVFHIHRRNIEGYALFSQMAIVTLTAVKTYQMGGMLHVGTPVYVGLIGPVYALILPNKRRAIYLFIVYTAAMISATLLNSNGDENYLFYRYFMGFLISNTAIFGTLYFFTTQWQKAKEAERQRMRELDELKTKFYTHIAHEFRTPLTLISGVVDQMKADPARWLSSGHEIVRRNSDKILHLTNQLLDLSKLQAKSMPLKLIHDDVVLYTRYLVESFDSMASDKGIQLHFSSTPEEIFMDLDPDKYQDIVSNLLSNALKFTPEGGSVRVLLSLMAKTSGNTLKLEVRDTGVGIALEDQPLIFNRYFQAGNHLDNGTPGSGLGLALTRELVRLMDGKIGLRSAPGKGTVFEVFLPVGCMAQKTPIPVWPETPKSRSAACEEPLPGREAADSEKGALHLLLVEDNKDVIEYLQMLLKDHYAVHTAVNGVEGLEKALETIPDLIISDVMMPGLDGYALTQRLKEDLRTSHIPIILLTARADDDSRLAGLESGADAYLAKPFNRQELFVRIRKLIALRRRLHKRYFRLADTGWTEDTGTEAGGTREDAFIGQVRQILEAHLDDEQFGISSLCQTIAMSRSQLYRKFAALTDVTVNQFILNLRLEKARELLKTTDLNVSEVAYDTGVKNPSHFSRACSNRFGHAPSQLTSNPIISR